MITREQLLIPVPKIQVAHVLVTDAELHSPADDDEFQDSVFLWVLEFALAVAFSITLVNLLIGTALYAVNPAACSSMLVVCACMLVCMALYVCLFFLYLSPRDGSEAQRSRGNKGGAKWSSIACILLCHNVLKTEKSF